MGPDTYQEELNDDVKNNMVKVLNEIVENYVYRDPNKQSYEGRSASNCRPGAELRDPEEGERRSQGRPGRRPPEPAPGTDHVK